MTIRKLAASVAVGLAAFTLATGSASADIVRPATSPPKSLPDLDVVFVSPTVFTIANVGTKRAEAFTAYVTAGSPLGSCLQTLDALYVRVPAIDVGEQRLFYIPPTSGSTRALWIDAYDEVYESDETNNWAEIPSFGC
jgi:hypothetical protein